jgi:hypothetical protein
MWLPTFNLLCCFQHVSSVFYTQIFLYWFNYHVCCIVYLKVACSVISFFQVKLYGGDWYFISCFFVLFHFCFVLFHFGFVLFHCCFIVVSFLFRFCFILVSFLFHFCFVSFCFIFVSFWLDLGRGGALEWGGGDTRAHAAATEKLLGIIAGK